MTAIIVVNSDYEIFCFGKKFSLEYSLAKTEMLRYIASSKNSAT